jgi:hypothetical protein
MDNEEENLCAFKADCVLSTGLLSSLKMKDFKEINLQ